MKTKPLERQTIVITGASSGIGLATSQLAARRGANVVLSSRNEADLLKIAKRLNDEGGRAIAVVADVSRREDVERLRDEAVKAFGGIDTWVNNAGASMYAFLDEEPLEEERQIFETNFWGVRHGCRVALEAMAEGGGVIINIGSEVSGRSIPLQGMYAASKHAVKAYTDALRMEIDKKGLPVAICLIRPAGIDTPFTEHARNELTNGAPSLPPPVYHPDLVAEAILDCARHPKRDVYVGGASKLFDVLDTIFPRLTDLFMEYTMFRQQSRGSEVPHRPRQEGLMQKPAHEGRLRGRHEGRVLRRSLSTSMQRHPWLSLTLAGLAVVAAAETMKARSAARM